MITAIRSVLVKDGSRKTLVFDGKSGRFIHIGDNTYPADEVIDGSGLEAYPGGIDPHVHDRDNGQGEETSETASTCVVAALAGGITTYFPQANTNPPITTPERLAIKIGQMTRLPISFRAYFGATPSSAGAIEDVYTDPLLRQHLAAIKLFMEPSTGGLLVAKQSDQLRLAKTVANHDGMISVHVGNMELLRQHWQTFDQALGRPRTVSDHCRLRPWQFERQGVLDALDIQRETGCRMHFHHLSCPEAIYPVIEALEQGADCSIEVCTHHTLASAARTAGYGGGMFKVNPPLRCASQVKEVGRILCQEEIPIIGATDHAPHPKEAKEREDYEEVPSGMTGIQTMMIIFYRFVASGQMSRCRFVDITSRNAAKRFGLLKKGELIVGYDADLILLDPNSSTVIRNGDMKSRCGFTPYAGMVFPGRITHVFRAGQLVHPS